MRTSARDRGSTRRFERRPRDDRDQIDQLATGLGDAVERLVRALDPNAPRPGLGDLFGSAATEPERCRHCGRTDCCPACCHDDHHHDHQHHGHRHHDHGCDRCGHQDHDDHHHHDHHHHHGCGCHRCSSDWCAPRCGHDDCRCVCCIGDADVVVYTRVGETRVVPINIENHRKRERDIKMTLADFRTQGGNDTPVTGRLVGPTEFTLPPCADHQGIILISAGLPGREPSKPSGDAVALDGLSKAELLAEAKRVGATATATMNKAELIGAISERPTEVLVEPSRDLVLPDVDDCHVAIADLCIEGCDARPIRVAVAVLPRDCNTYDIHCECACC